MENTSIGVVYLCWLPYGTDCLQTFLYSYKQHTAGVAHQLVIVFKGHQSPNDVLPFIQALNKQQISFFPLYYTGRELDISTYHWAASQIETEFVFFLNTRSKILANNWLAYFYHATVASPGSVFCATGSWQSYVSSVFKQHSWAYKLDLSFNKNWIKYKLLIKAATLWWCYFPLFPNPHIRTNAFFINRTLFLSLKIKKITAKIDAYRFESGRNSFTNQLKNLRYKVALISSTGELFNEIQWAESSIFWSNEQKNLLIADNQTELYSNADSNKKKLLSKLAWG